MNDPSNGKLVISLDFELLWGVFDVVDFEKKRGYFENTRKVIPEILKLFEKYQVHATWATVGMLFNSDWDEWQQNIPECIPAYVNQELNAYSFGKKIISSNTESMCFAPDLIKRISRIPGQEIGTHTYSHYYCTEPGQNVQAFKADLDMVVKMADKMDISIHSLVFPRNQLRDDYLESCFRTGVKNVRSNPSSWYWKNANSEALTTRLARSGDAYFPFGKKLYSLKDISKIPGMPVEQKAGRLLRPVEDPFLRKLKLIRIKKEMEQAAKEDKIYHLWWHPHNFGDRPMDSMNDLKLILKHLDKLRKKYNFQSVNMQEIGSLLF